MNCATKDQATEEIQESMLGVKRFGMHQLKEFVQERLLSPTCAPDHKKFHSFMVKSIPATFVKLYEVKKSDGKTSSIKTDRSVLQRLVICYAAGRDVDLDGILKHKLSPIPLSLAKTDGSLKEGQKHPLMDILLQRITCSNQYDVPKDATLVVDGQALVVALGKPQSLEIRTFGDFAKSYCECIFQHGG